MIEQQRPRTQAERIFAKFGGVPTLYRAMQRLPEARRRSKEQIYRWNYPPARGGSNGLIPTSALRDVLEAARLEGIVIAAEDLYGGGK